MLRVALTGGIASGKSSAANAFRKLGVPVIDTDEIARDVVERNSPGLKALVDAFGNDILLANGALDRAKLRKRIFADADVRERVNAVLHPLILKELDAQLAELERAPSPPRYVVIEIPLLTETRLAAAFDRILVVDVPEAVQVQRLEARDGVSQEQARAAIAAQASRESRLKIATDVLDNSGRPDALQRAVNALHERYLA